MDTGKGKPGIGRGKNKAPQYPSDLFVLGKSRSSEPNNDGKRTVSSVSSHTKVGPSSSALGKRDGTTIQSMVPNKKSKTVPIETRVGTSSSGAETWEMVAIECDPPDLVPFVLDACDMDQADKVVGLLCGAIRSLRNQRWKPDPILYLGLQYLCQVRTSLFSGECVTFALCSLLRRDPQHSFKSKGNALVPVLGATLLLNAFVDKKNWPEAFLRLYVEDALNERVWVDQDLCTGFVNNILKSINSRIPPKSLLEPLTSGILGRASPSETLTSQAIEDEGPALDIPVRSRYSACPDSVEAIVTEAVKEQLNRRQPPENITRNFLKLLAATCGLVEIRAMIAPRLELWLQNPKLNRPAQDLLMSVCVNCVTHNVRDVDVISHLIKIRLKTKALVQLYIAGIRELITANPSNLETIMRHTVYNELSTTSRNPNNMAMLTVMFQSAPEEAATLLAEIFQDLLLNREDYLRPLRALLREIARVVRHDMNLPMLCRGLMADRKDLPQFRDFEYKERMFTSITDLVALCVFLTITPAVREAASLLARGDKRDIQVLQSFQMQVAGIQRDTVWWLHETVPRMYRPGSVEFVHALHKILFIESPEQYYKVDNWPMDSERVLMMRLASEVPILQHTLIRIFIISLSKDHPLSPADALELADQLLKRAALLPTDGLPMLQADNLDVIDLLFNMTAYHHPDSIDLPEDYEPPQMAISPLYWKAWTMLLILSAHNPTTFGYVMWKKYPTLRMFMEMCITNHFTYPPPSSADEDHRIKETQLAAREKSQILEFESLLAAGSTKKTITEQTSLLLTTLITMDPTGPCRKPPQTILDQLQALNASHRLGHLLCRSRQPDFLLDIIQRQGSVQSMPWLADLVDSSEGALGHLPVQCLCEFLLSSSTLTQPERQSKHEQLLLHLQQVLTDVEQDPQAPCEVLEYFLRRLSAPLAASRSQAIKGLQLVLRDEGDNRWLLKQLPQLPHFASVRPQVVVALRQACQVENEVPLVAAYIIFLAQHTVDDSLADLTELVQDMAQLIVERSCIVAALLPANHSRSTLETHHALMTMFHVYLQKARSPQREGIGWSESMDQIRITWSTGEECTMHILVVHAVVILLNHGPGLDARLFEKMLDIWFPLGQEPPRAYLVDTSEEALLLPDWLKLRMIRSEVDRLVDAALVDLEPSSLVLFIQSFGIPVPSMNKLLAKLDQAVVTDKELVSEAVLDKTYIAQLVEVQHHRGAVGGERLVHELQLEQPRLPASSQKGPLRGPLPLPSPMDVDGTITQFLTPQQITVRIHKLFGEWEESVPISEKRAIFRDLQRRLSIGITKSADVHTYAQEPIELTIIETFVYLLDRVQSSFITALLKSPQFSCPFFRLLAAGSKLYENRVQDLIHKLLDILPPGSKSPLVGLLKQTAKDVRKKRDVPKEGIGPSSAPVVDHLRTSPLATLERTGRQLIDQDRTEEVVEAMARLLVQNDSTLTSGRTGLLIDWLAELEPELIGSNPELQMKLLFSKMFDNVANSGQSSRPYLLTLLTHRASWRTLNEVTQKLLNDTNINYDPKAVLDFLWALTSNPRLWQGREKKTPKHYIQEDILCLTSTQLQNLVMYMVQEAADSLDTSEEKLQARLPLLCRCIVSKQQMLVVAKHVSSLVEKQEGLHSNIGYQLLIQLYLRSPSIIFSVPQLLQDDKLIKASTAENSTCAIDYVSHSLITALTAINPTKDWAKRSQDYELATRKLASVHPVMVLRQLPMLAASLRGRVHLDWIVLRQRHHLILLHQVLGILDLLKPHVFREEYSQSLEEALDVYFALFNLHLVEEKGIHTLKKQSGQKEAFALLNQVADILKDFVQFDASRALRYIQGHTTVLQEVTRLHPHASGSVRSLLIGLPLPLTLAPAPLPPEPPHLSPMLATLNKLFGEDVYSVLQELDHLTLRKPVILDQFAEHLCQLLLSPWAQIRTISHTLLARHLRHNPANNKIGVDAFLRCFNSDLPDIINSALERLPEMVSVAEERALPLMQKVFQLGIYNHMNTLPHICKAVGLLNAQKGC